MQGTQQPAAAFVTCNVHNWQLHFCHMQGTQQTAAPFVICKVRNRLLRLYRLQGSQHTAKNPARHVIDRTFSPARYSQGTHWTVALLPVRKQQTAENLHLQGIQQIASTFSHIHNISLIANICTLCKRNKQLHFFTCKVHKVLTDIGWIFLIWRNTATPYCQQYIFVCHKCRRNITLIKNIFTIFNDGATSRW
jgi:hypothetical protein